MTDQQIFELTHTERQELPRYQKDAAMTCPNCRHYNAMLAVYSPAGYVLRCRDCGYLARCGPDEKD